MGHIRGTAGRSADGKEGGHGNRGVGPYWPCSPPQKGGIWEPWAVSRPPPYLWKALQDRVFSQGTLLTPGAG